MKILENTFRYGLRMLMAGAALHGLSTMTLAEDVQSAEFQTSNASRGKQVALVSDEQAPPPPSDESPARIQNQGPGVARVPGCTSTACQNGVCTVRAGVCGPLGCGANGSPSCPSRDNENFSGNGYAMNDVGQTWCGIGHATRHAMKKTMVPTVHVLECDWNDEIADGSSRGSGYGNGTCPEYGQQNGSHYCSWLHDQWDMFNAHNRQQGEILRAQIHGKLAYFHPMGNGGEGVPPFGCYHLVYAANPDYSDPRDSQLYAAQGYGVPISVPLAPTVRHTMNYSTGMPSSRLTPISNVVPPRRGRHW